MIARAYVRVSTQRQGEGASLGTQLSAMEQYAEEHGLTIISVYQDMLSGTTANRPEYQRLLTDAARGDTILCWALDRGGRNVEEMYRFRRIIEERGASLIFVTQPEMENRLVFGMNAVVAEWFSEQNRAKVMPNMAARVQEGKWVSRPPRWYRIGADGTLEPTANAHEAQQVWDTVLATGSIERAAALFNLNTNTLRNTLKLRTYLGETVWNGIVIPGTHPAIVQRATWEAVNALRATRAAQKRRQRQNTAMLTGFIYVADTEQRLYHYLRRKRGGVNRYYVTKAGDHTPYHSVRADDAERTVVDALASLTLDKANIFAIEREMRARTRDDPHKRERAMLRRKIAGLDTERIETARMEAQRRITPADADRMRAEQERERATATAHLAALPAEWDGAAAATLHLRLQLADRIRSAYAAGDVVALRLLIEAFIARIEVWGGETRTDYYRQPPREVRIVWQANVRTGPTLSN